MRIINILRNEKIEDKILPLDSNEEQIYIIESGIYNINKTIFVSSNTTILSNGFTKLNININDDIFKTYKPFNLLNNIKIENIDINININNFNSTIIYMNSVENLDLNNINISSIYNINGYGISCVNSKKIRIKNNNVNKLSTNCYLYNSSNFTVENNYFNNSYETKWGHDGLLVEKSENGKIISNEFCDNAEHGLYLSGVNNCIITNNICNKNKNNGMRIGDYPLNSSNNLIVNNNICNNNNINGIHISDNTHSSNFISNKCNGNSNYGLISAFEIHPSYKNLYCNNSFFDNISIEQYKILDENFIIKDNIL